MGPKEADEMANSVDPDLGLHCFLKPVCPKTSDHDGIDSADITLLIGCEWHNQYQQKEQWRNNGKKNTSRLMTKPTKWHVRPAKTQISLGIRPVWSESSLSAWRKLGSLATHWAHSEDSDQTGRMPKLIWVFVGCTCHFVSFVTRRLSHEVTTLEIFQCSSNTCGWSWYIAYCLPHDNKVPKK